MADNDRFRYAADLLHLIRYDLFVRSQGGDPEVVIFNKDAATPEDLEMVESGLAELKESVAKLERHMMQYVEIERLGNSIEGS